MYTVTDAFEIYKTILDSEERIYAISESAAEIIAAEYRYLEEAEQLFDDITWELLVDWDKFAEYCRTGK